MNKKGKSNYKLFTIILVVIILTFAISAYIFKYMPEQKKKAEIQSYKKAMFDSVACQYSCPLESQQIPVNDSKTGKIVNKTQLLPGLECVKNCTAAYKQQFEAGSSITDKELLEDNFLKDIQTVIVDCRKASLNTTTLTTDNVFFFSCTTTNIQNLKTNYTYLR